MITWYDITWYDITWRDITWRDITENKMPMKKLTILIPFLLFILVSCQDKEAQEELDKMKAQSELEEQNRALVEKYIQVWNQFDMNMLDEYLSPEFKVFIPSSTGEPMSLEQFREWIGGVFAGFPDSHYNIEDIFCQGDRVCVRWTYAATHQGEWSGIPATGTEVTGSAIEIFTVKNGKIVEERSEMDAMGLMQQLGFSLSAGVE